MNDDWIGIDGYRCAFAESPTGAGLIKALASISTATEIEPSRIEGYATLLASTADVGRDQELPRNRIASIVASEKELRKLDKLISDLADHIKTMHQPAVSALYAEGAHLFSLEKTLREWADMPRYAFGALSVDKAPCGAPTKVVAADVADMAAHYFEMLSGKRPTYTTDPQTGKISGAWPDFLEAVYMSLRIDASVPSQVRAIREKTRAR